MSNVNGLKHSPQKWERDNVRRNTNCYAYALDLTKNVKNDSNFCDWADVQPGNICGRNEDIEEADFHLWENELITHAKEGIKNFVKAFYEDCKYLGYKVVRAKWDEYKEGGWWKVALYWEMGDYHWYRQDNDGNWSHKIGKSNISKLDKSGKIITDPRTCNRGNYNKFIGCFLIRKVKNPFAK
jgi:hypothetical protein